MCSHFCRRAGESPKGVLDESPMDYFFNDFLKGIMGFELLRIPAMLPLSVYTAYSHDTVQ